MKKDCVCAAVVCPANAPTVWDDGMPPPTPAPTPTSAAAKPTTTPTLVAKEPEAPDTVGTCCCCDPATMVMTCTRSIRKDECMCAAVACPRDAKVIWADKKPNYAGKPTTPVTVTEAPHAIPSTKGKDHLMRHPPKAFVTVTKRAQREPLPRECELAPFPTGSASECCCCNPRTNKVVCRFLDKKDCVCLAVMCPRDAETIHIAPPTCTGV
jgi:hypothetical protein